ncbi:unnamed protein product [Onchocerca flexuosa]|uniref:HIT-type domain-containing protein n=1 Tax=Onchocerca flexuosa TaxID=387005 RepID=A0A183HFN3_9BILA|nr:unnamed protein product [Onchocerca flexuosa]
MKEFRQILDDLERRVFQLVSRSGLEFTEVKTKALATSPTSMPHWICKPYYRPVRNDSSISDSLYRERRRAELDALAQKTGLSKRQLRKREKRKVSNHQYIHNQAELQIEDRKEQCKNQAYSKCLRCDLPASQDCTFVYCRNCCRFKAATERKDCKSLLLLFLFYTKNFDFFFEGLYDFGNVFSTIDKAFEISAHNFHFATKIPWCYREHDGTTAIVTTLISGIMGL